MSERHDGTRVRHLTAGRGVAVLQECRKLSKHERALPRRTGVDHGDSNVDQFETDYEIGIIEPDACQDASTMVTNIDAESRRCRDRLRHRRHRTELERPVRLDPYGFAAALRTKEPFGERAARSVARTDEHDMEGAIGGRSRGHTSDVSDRLYGFLGVEDRLAGCPSTSVPRSQ